MWRSAAAAVPYALGNAGFRAATHPFLSAPADSGVAEYGLLDLRALDESWSPRNGLLGLPSSNPYLVAATADTGASTPTGRTDPEQHEFDRLRRLNEIVRALLGLGPVRDDLIEDSDGNILAPEVSELIRDIVSAAKADEPALRRRINEMFQGEPRTGNWFHQHLSDLLAGDPPEEIQKALSNLADERARDARVTTAQVAGLIDVPAAAVPSRTRPFTHLNDPVPRDPNMEEFRRLLHDYKRNQGIRALQRDQARPADLPSMRGKHWNQQGKEFEGVAMGYDTAYGENVGPRLRVERPSGLRIYDYTLLDRHGLLRNPVEAKSGQGYIPSRQRRFDATMAPPVIYRKEEDVIPDGLRMLNHYDRLWMLRNPVQQPGAWTIPGW